MSSLLFLKKTLTVILTCMYHAGENSVLRASIPKVAGSITTVPSHIFSLPGVYINSEKITNINCYLF